MKAPTSPMPWQVLSSEEDCQQLLGRVGGLHDGCLREMQLWSKHSVDQDLNMRISPGLDMRARLLFQRQFREPSALELFFEEILELQIGTHSLNDDSIILDADLHFRNAFFTF